MSHKDHDPRKQFALEMLSHTEVDKTYHERPCSSDEVMFLVYVE
jgi:hypothetical protein